MAAFYGQRLHFTRELNALHYGGHLFQQYIVDVAIKTKQNALNFLVNNQVKLCVELYQGLQDMLAQDANLNAAQVGRHIMLPVATPLWPSVGVKPNTWKSYRFGALWDSRMFRAQ